MIPSMFTLQIRIVPDIILSFVEVGINKGNYIPLFNAANGQVFQWVQPVNGVPQGNFEAAAFLVTPKKQQVDDYWRNIST